MKKINVILTLSLLAVSTLAHAKPLTLMDWSNDAISVTVGKYCAGEFGVILPGDSKTVPQIRLGILCEGNSDVCPVKLFIGPGCDGDQIAEFNISVKEGMNPSSLRISSDYGYQISPNHDTLLITDAKN